MRLGGRSYAASRRPVLVVPLVALLSVVAPGSSPPTLAQSTAAVSPSVYSAYTGTDAKPIPPAPVLGPANSVFNDPTFGSRILRVTDQNTLGGASLIPTDAGFHRTWNANSTAIKLTNAHGQAYWLEFNPGAFSVGDGSSRPTLHPLSIPYTWEWSTVDPDAIYFLNGNQIAKYNKATGAVTSLGGPSNGDPVVSYAVVVGLDNWVCSAAGSGIQDTFTEIFCVDPSNTSNRKFIDVPNKTINGVPQSDPNWPTSAAGQTIGIHSLSGGTGASWLGVTFHQQSWGGNGDAVLNLSTDTWSLLLGSDPHWGGHVSVGNGRFVNGGGSIDGRDSRGAVVRDANALVDPSKMTYIMQPPTTVNWYDAEHSSWFNSTSNPNAPVLFSRYTNISPSPWLTWIGEIMLAATDGSNTVWRFAHNHNGAMTAGYYTQSFAQISNDGNWALFSSWWDGTLGASSGGDFGVATRIDTFIVELAHATSADTTPPSVTLTAPAGGTIVSGTTVTVSASASDNVGVVGVQFLLDGAPLGAEVTTAPYATTWDTSAASLSTHTLAAVARDAAGNRTTSAATSVTLVLAAPAAPVISAVSASSITSSGAAIIWTTDITSDSQVVYGPTTSYGSATALDTTLLTAHTQTLSGLAPGSLYHYCVKSKDSLGDLATSADATFSTLSSPAPAPSSGPIGLWKLDDGSGTTALDSSGSGFNGTLLDGPAWVSGVVSGALSFDGVDDLVDIPHAAALDAYPLTVAAWVKTAATGLGGIVNKYYPSSWNGWQIFTNGGNLCAWYFRDSADAVWDGSTCTLATPGVNDNRWHHVAFVVDASGGRLYVDGVQTAARAWTGTPGPATTTLDLSLGRYPDAVQQYFPGSLDDVRLYNRALGSDEIVALAATADTTPPVITAVAASAVTSFSATVTWSTDEPSDSQVEYGPTTAYGSSTALDATPVTAHAQNLGGLASAVAYHYRVRSKDTAGNLAVSGDFTFTTPDTVPPAVSITAPAAGASVTGTVSIAASASDNVGVAGVQFRLDGAALGAEVTVAPYAIAWDTSTTTAGAHTLTALARDAAGNTTTSAPVSVSVTLPAPPPAPAPGGGGGPKGYWKLDDGSGATALDSSGNGFNGTLLNGPAWVPGVLSGALSFDGVNDYVRIAHDPALDAYPLTVAAWVKTAATGLGGIVNKYYPSSWNGWQIFTNGGNLCAWYFRDSADAVWDGSTCTLATPGVNDNRWHHVAFVVDASGGRLYVDGVQRSSRAWTGIPGPTTTTINLNLGRYPGSVHPYFAGSLDDVRLYNRALGSDEIAGLYGGTASPLQNVAWTSLVNATATGNSLQKTSGCDGCQDAGAVSQQQIASGDGYFEFTAVETDALRFAGLSNGNPGTSAAEIQFAIRLQTGYVDVRENGVYRAGSTFVTGDVFRVAVESGVVKYYQNGTLLYTSAAAPVYPLLVDTCLFNLGATVGNAVINGAQ